MTAPTRTGSFASGCWRARRRLRRRGSQFYLLVHGSGDGRRAACRARGRRPRDDAASFHRSGGRRRCAASGHPLCARRARSLAGGGCEPGQISGPPLRVAELIERAPVSTRHQRCRRDETFLWTDRRLAGHSFENGFHPTGHSISPSTAQTATRARNSDLPRDGFARDVCRDPRHRTGTSVVLTQPHCSMGRPHSRLSATDRQVVAPGRGWSSGSRRTSLFRPQMPLEDIPPVLAASDALLVPLSAHTTFKQFVPSKLTDFMATGRPVLLAADGESARILNRAGGGVVVAPEDPRALASCGSMALGAPGRGGRDGATGPRVRAQAASLRPSRTARTGSLRRDRTRLVGPEILKPDADSLDQFCCDCHSRDQPQSPEDAVNCEQAVAD